MKILPEDPKLSWLAKYISNNLRFCLAVMIEFTLVNFALTYVKKKDEFIDENILMVRARLYYQFQRPYKRKMKIKEHNS